MSARVMSEHGALDSQVSDEADIRTHNRNARFLPEADVADSQPKLNAAKMAEAQAFRPGLPEVMSPRTDLNQPLV
jgi:hypothetical protein